MSDIESKIKSYEAKSQLLGNNALEFKIKQNNKVEV